MRKTRSLQLITVAVFLATFLMVIPSWAGSATCLEKAKAESINSGLPILIKVGTEWSEASADFDNLSEADDDIRAALEKHVVLCTVDAKKSKGVEVAAMYSVRNFPTFILTNSHGETIDRWYGFACHECFVKRLVKSVEDQVTVNERVLRFQDDPTEEDAGKLGDIRHAEGLFAEAAAYYRRAHELNPDSEWNYDTLIFNSMAYGNYYQLYSTDQVKNQADIVLASDKRSDKDLIKVAMSMYKVSHRTNDLTAFLPYLKAGVEETANSEDEGVLKKRAKLVPEYTLHIEKDTDKAITLKKESMPEAWLENAKQLNTFAWWCFQNKVNLPEAQIMAQRGIELASAGREKANILDTLAEICNLSGDCGEAVDYIRMAVIEDPENEYFQEQLVRFEKLLAVQR